jgi:phage tail-like protein
MIDSNQTRYHLLLGANDWARCKRDDGAPVFSPDAVGGKIFSWTGRNEITLGERANLFHSATGNVPPRLDRRRGAARDRFDNMYWIADSTSEILVTSSGTGATSHFWSSNDETTRHCSAAGAFADVEVSIPPSPLRFNGLMVTKQHYLVAGVLEPAGLVIFDLFHGGPPRQLIWPSNIPFEPFDMVPAAEGGVWILDRKNRRYWALDRSFAVIRQHQPEIPLPESSNVFIPADGTAPPVRAEPVFPSGFSLDLASPLSPFDPIAIEALPDGSVFFLESDTAGRFSKIHRFRDGQELGAPVVPDSILEVLAPQDRAGFSLRGYDFVFIANEQVRDGTRQNTLYIVGENGDQAWAFTAVLNNDRLELAPIAEYYPMRLFGGKGLIAGKNHVFYDSQDSWIPLVMQKRPRYVEKAALITPIMDGKETDCIWHRLMLDAVLPYDAHLLVRSRASNDRASIDTQTWNNEPGPYQRTTGTELPWTQTAASLGTWELLFQKASGRYLQLKITFSGNGRTSPRIRALRAYYPRFSYLQHYLPAVYRENSESASFVDRFLANLEGFFTSIEDRIATVQALIDASSAPKEALDWLANWFGVAFDPAWTESRRRLFLLNIAKFFEARGTVPGLMMALRLTLDSCESEEIFTSPLTALGEPRIVEKYQTRNLPVGLLQKRDTSIGLPVMAQPALWTPAQGADELDRRYRESLELKTSDIYPIFMSPTDPLYAQWAAFSKQHLGFVPVDPAVSDLWTLFLRNRYSVISALVSAYHISYSGFEKASYPESLPRLTEPLWDWYQFQGLLLVQAAAHQFTVFLPMPLGDAQNVLAHRSKMSLARRVIELEKPAHTDFEIKFYWAFFRLGDARLGEDTVLDQSSRAPQLMLPALLGDTFIGSAYISNEQPGQLRRRPLFTPGTPSAKCRQA